MFYFAIFFPILHILIYYLLKSDVATANDSINIWSNESAIRLEINPKFISGMGRNLISKKKNESLNLTCTIQYDQSIKHDTSFDYTLDWTIPFHVINSQKIVKGQNRTMAWLWFNTLTESHSGNYTCNGMDSKHPDKPLLSIDISLSVKSKITFCGSQSFKCRSKHCIMERYLCDGKKDCEEGEDESLDAGCGPNPCYGKIFCDDRCVPPEWCCDHRNCSTNFGYQPWPPETHEINYVQTALYHTLIGWAMAFMFIVTILLIAICRGHIKRVMDARWQQSQSICHQSEQSQPPGINIMYNLDNVVQFVGQPVDPPPYSEVINTPVRDGPPPTYESCEHIIDQTVNTRIVPEYVARGQNDILSAVPCSYDISCGKSTIDTTNIFQHITRPQTLSNVIASSSISAQNNFDNNSSAISSTIVNRPNTFDIQHVETDALLSDVSNDCNVKISNKFST